MQPAPRNLWLPLLIAGIIGAGLLGSLFFPPFAVWAGIMMALFGIILLGHPRHLLFFFWLWVAVQPLVIQISENFVIQYAEESLLVALTAIFVTDYIQRRTEVRGISWIFKIATGLLGIALASWLMNRSSIVGFANFVVTYLSFPVVFYAAYTTLDRRHWRYLVGSIVGLMLIQFALNIGWRLGVNPLPNDWKGTINIADMAQGTFASSAMVAYFMVCTIFFLFSAFRLSKKYRSWILLLLGIAGVQLYMTYTNHSYIFFILFLPIYLALTKASVRMRLGFVGLALLVALLFALLSAKDTYRSFEFGGKSQLAENFDRQNLEYRWDRFVQGPKIELISRIAVQNATKKPYLWLLGNGPGNGLSAIGMTRSSAFAWEYLGEFVSNTDLFKGKQMTSISGSFYSGILSIWSELGVGGYLLYMAFYIYLLLHVSVMLARAKYPDPFQLMLAEGFVMAALLFLLCSFLGDVFYLRYFGSGLCIWAAMVWDPVEVAGPSTENEDSRSGFGEQPVPAVNRWQKRPLRK